MSTLISTPAAVQQSQTQNQSQTDLSKASLNYDSFLKLLLQQLKSQDPTSPVDQKETLAQLASFSNVEQTIKLNQKLDLLLDQQRVVEASSVVGKHVESLTNGGTGRVVSVDLIEGRMFAKLDSGVELELTKDIRISA
jgi:flagellar basal-body rod modification protein FlgD